MKQTVVVFVFMAAVMALYARVIAQRARALSLDDRSRKRLVWTYLASSILVLCILGGSISLYRAGYVTVQLVAPLVVAVLLSYMLILRSLLSRLR